MAYERKPYTRKVWVNVPDPSSLPDIPEGQNALARFDEDNMNRIEDGIEEALSSVSVHTHSKSDVGLGNVDNTSDANKPVSTAQATAIADAKKAGTDAQSGLNSHLDDTTKHITTTERNTWNGKANATDLSNHDTNTTKHITSAERTAWNGKANANHTHTPASIGAAATSHNQGANTITAGTLGGQVKANAGAVSAIGTAQVRNIYADTRDLTAGSSTLATGDIYFVYE